MRKDPTEFRKRFLAWKDGLLVYDKGRPTELPKYEDGIVGSIKNAILGASIAEDPAIATAAGWQQTGGNVVQLQDQYTRLLGNALTELSFFSPTNPVNALMLGALNLGGKAAKFVKPRINRNIAALNTTDVKPLSDIDGLTTEDFLHWIQGKHVDELSKKMPSYFNPVVKDVPQDIIESILNSVTPRLAEMRPFLNAEDVERSVLNSVTRKYNEFPIEAYLRAGEGRTLGMHIPSTDFISIRQGSVDRALLHELRHSLYDLHTPVPEEEKIINEAYNELFPYNDEKFAFNGDSRMALIGKDADKTMSIPKQNELIDSASKKQTIKAVNDASSYGKTYIKNIKKEYGDVPDHIIDAIKTAMKRVAIATGIAPAVKNKSKK